MITVGALVVLLIASLVATGFLGRSLRRAKAQIGAEREARLSAEAEEFRQGKILAALMKNLNDGVGVIDGNGDFLAHNPAAKWLLGIENDDGDDSWQESFGIFRADGETPFPPEELPLVRALANETTENVEMVIRDSKRPEGVLISISGRPLDPTGGQRGAIAVFHDITEFRRQQEELESFAGVVAHDLKSPLSVIGGNIELVDMILGDMEGDVVQQARERLVHATNGVARMLNLIDDLLMYSRARDAMLNVTEFDLTHLVDDVVTARLQDAQFATAPVPIVDVQQLPRVVADPVLLRQLIDNLVGNAIKYTPHGEAARIEISAKRTSQSWATIAVSDHGIGIPKGSHAAVFKQFHRAQNGTSYAGTGLGLAICQRIIERHGGSIGVRDNEGGGSRFWFTLPLAQKARFAHESPPMPAPHVRSA